jgi:hypothetical protein
MCLDFYYKVDYNRGNFSHASTYTHNEIMHALELAEVVVLHYCIIHWRCQYMRLKKYIM